MEALIYMVRIPDNHVYGINTDSDDNEDFTYDGLIGETPIFSVWCYPVTDGTHQCEIVRNETGIYIPTMYVVNTSEIDEDVFLTAVHKHIAPWLEAKLMVN